jgi:hypothetical protein
MRSEPILDPARTHAKDCRERRGGTCTRTHATLLSVVAALLLMGAPGAAKAVDGCLVLLCLVAPSWRAIPQCVPPIRQLFRDLARGRSFPSCSMAGAGNSATHAWAQAPYRCPPQYTRMLGPIYTCDYSGVVTVSVDGRLFSRTWWARSGGSVTEFSPAAKAQFGQWDTRFDDDHAAWLASLPPASTDLMP